MSTTSWEREKSLLQRVIAACALIPIVVGAWGILFGAAGLTGDRMGVSGDSHYRFLSGLLLGIGLVFWSAIPSIETKGGRVQVATLIVLAGGLGRLTGLILTGLPSLTMIGALLLELGAVPLICLWQMRIARRRPTPE